MTDTYDLTLKLLIAGDSSVGKTNFTNRNWNIQSNTKRKNNFSYRSLKYNLNKNRIQKEDLIFYYMLLFTEVNYYIK